MMTEMYGIRIDVPFHVSSLGFCHYHDVVYLREGERCGQSAQDRGRLMICRDDPGRASEGRFVCPLPEKTNAVLAVQVMHHVYTEDQPVEIETNLRQQVVRAIQARDAIGDRMPCVLPAFLSSEEFMVSQSNRAIDERAGEQV